MSAGATLRRVSSVLAIVLALSGSVPLAEATEIEDYGRDLFLRGGRAIRQSRFAEAQALFERSLAYIGQRNALWNLAACHLAQGHRDLAVAFLERYMEMHTPYQESSEMQAAVAAIADGPTEVGDMDRVEELWLQINQADEAIREGRSTPVAGDERRFGMGSRGTDAKAILARRSATGTGHDLFVEGLRLIEEQRYPEALESFERSWAYRGYRNTLWNIAACHLSQGRRDFALHFLQGYLDRTPEARESTQVQELVGVIADEPPNIPNIARRYEIWGDLATAIDEAMGVPPTRPDEGGS